MNSSSPPSPQSTTLTCSAAALEKYHKGMAEFAAVGSSNERWTAGSTSAAVLGLIGRMMCSHPRCSGDLPTRGALVDLRSGKAGGEGLEAGPVRCLRHRGGDRARIRRRPTGTRRSARRKSCAAEPFRAPARASPRSTRSRQGRCGSGRRGARSAGLTLPTGPMVMHVTRLERAHLAEDRSRPEHMAEAGRSRGLRARRCRT